MKLCALWFTVLSIPVLAAPSADSTANTPPPPGSKAPSGPITRLEPFKVRGAPINSFGFDIAIYWDRKTRKVTRMFVGEVHDGSEAAELDLAVGDEIRTINGRPVTEFIAGVDAESELGKIFLARTPGETLDLEIIRHRPGRLKLTARPVRPD